MSTSHGWFDVEVIGPGVWSIAEPGHEEEVHSYLIEGERDVAVLDTGMGVGDFRGLVAELSDREPLVVQSHAHWDHIGASAHFERVLVHPSEAQAMGRDFPNEQLRWWFRPETLRGIPFPEGFDLDTAMIPGASVTGYLNHGDRIDLGARVIEIHHTPGHSPGGVTVYDERARLLFPADAVNLGPLYLFSGQADLAAYRHTLDILADLAGRSDAVYPSHYDVPMTPEDVVATRDAFAEILAGREPDEVREDREVYAYERFVFWIRPGAVEAMR
jgi:glyoxylase-like metal-dependent hydrolase (beta-lactamase superfamily II)